METVWKLVKTFYCIKIIVSIDIIAIIRENTVAILKCNWFDYDAKIMAIHVPNFYV